MQWKRPSGPGIDAEVPTVPTPAAYERGYRCLSAGTAGVGIDTDWRCRNYEARRPFQT